MILLDDLCSIPIDIGRSIQNNHISLAFSKVIHITFPWHNFFKLNSSKQKYTLTLSVIVKSPVWVLQSVCASSLLLRRFIFFSLNILYMYPLYNSIWDLLYSGIPCTTRKSVYGGILWVHGIYYEILRLFSTFPPLPIYFELQCFSK